MSAHPRDDGPHEQAGDSRFKALTESASHALGVLDRAFKLRYVSPAIERVLGHRPEELRGRSAFELAHPDDRPALSAALERLLAAPDATLSLSARGRHKDGSYRQIELSAHNLLDDALGAIVMDLRDVTELVALTESERRFRMLAENARDVVARYRLLPTPGFEYISPSVERVLGYTPAELYADPYSFWRLIAPEDRNQLTGLASGGAREELTRRPQTLSWLRKDGERVSMEQQTVLIYDAAGRLTAAETIARDVSEKVRLEEQLRQAQKLDAIGTLAGGIAHDFNNLLMTIFAHLARLEARLVSDPEGLAVVAAIQDTAQGAAALSDQLLSFARKGVRMSLVVDLRRAVVQFESMLRRLLPQNVTIRIEHSASESRVRCDPNQLDQVLLNLALNARDAMPQGGTLTLKIGPGLEGCVQLVVHDTGVGFADEDLPHVFEPFFASKRRPSSSGLGLAVVRGIVERAGGSIEIESHPESGTRFLLELPTTEEPVESISQVVPATPAPAGGQTLLLVEDQRAVREVLAQVLRDEGYRVIEAESGSAALRRAAGEEVAVLITDMMMPDMGGASLVERMRARHPDLPVVCMSGYAGDEVDPRVAAGPRTAFLSKPFLPDELLATLGVLLA